MLQGPFKADFETGDLSQMEYDEELAARNATPQKRAGS